ncbi:MAG: hydrogenase 3 maturation endopeptidase HyCI [Candidatus Omnitrophica bacterium]|nr:hydrogenase 3 maturation endopeptidase HyCI [Candidatus Omnitrophota bacterium]MDD5593075.1 hydrogenase 3 maturation endopeptidase HyCI [Candidatus Omnitrophota bacterium]
MRSLKTTLKNKLQGAERVAVLGVGSDLRADDAVGLLVAGELKKACVESDNRARLKVFLGNTAPENLTGEIKKFCPTHIIIVDAADGQKEPGAVTLIDPGETGGISFCTHQLPPKIIADYLVKSLRCKVIIIGIQPKALDFGASPSKEVIKSAKDIAAMIKGIIKGEN